MVLKKRKRDGELTTWTPASQASGSAEVVPEVEPELAVARDAPMPPARITRSNPRRSTRTSKSEDVAPAPKSAPAKKPRATRANKAPTPPEPPVVEPAPEPTAVPIHSYNFPQPGPSSQLVAPVASGSSAPPPAKKRKGKKAAADNDAGSSQPEKRGAQFKSFCPQNIRDRLARVKSQRICMIARERNGEELREEFSVLGSTCNVYTVIIDRTPRCDCPDACRGNHCKHILFVFIKVLQVSEDSGYWYQKALLSSELQEIFANAPLAPNSIAHQHIRDAYARATGKVPAAGPSTGAADKNKRIPGPDDDCPICYDGMHGAAETSLTFCEECGNALHKECFQQWQGTAARNGKELTCVWCRARWVIAPAPGVGGVGGATRTTHGHGYLNLAAVTGHSPVRDTSTYYHGPRRGQRYYGYNQYDDV